MKVYMWDLRDVHWGVAQYPAGNYIKDISTLNLISFFYDLTFLLFFQYVNIHYKFTNLKQKGEKKNMRIPLYSV